MNIGGKIFDSRIAQLNEAIEEKLQREIDDFNFNIRPPRLDYFHNTNSFLQHLRRIEMLNTVRPSDCNALLAAIKTHIIRTKFDLHEIISAA